MIYFTMLGYIFGIDCQTTLQVQEKLKSRLPVKIYVQLLCSFCGRILGQLSEYWATQELCKNINFAMESQFTYVWHHIAQSSKCEHKEFVWDQSGNRFKKITFARIFNENTLPYLLGFSFLLVVRS